MKSLILMQFKIVIFNDQAAQNPVLWGVAFGQKATRFEASSSADILKTAETSELLKISSRPLVGHDLQTQAQDLFKDLHDMCGGQEEIGFLGSPQESFWNKNFLGRNCMGVAWENAPLEFHIAQKWAELLKNEVERLAEINAPKLAEARRRKSLLLHVCCGPDAAGVIEQLNKDFDLTCFWYDPNIQPREEHDLRLAAFEKVARIENVPAIIGEYDVDRFEDEIRGLEHTPEKGAKCSKCYDMRLERAAVEAKKGGFDMYATTLAISPHKVQEKLISFGKLSEQRLGVKYFHRDFKKMDGFKDSVDYTREHDIYRQDYCGCVYSLKDGGPDARQKASDWGFV